MEHFSELIEGDGGQVDIVLEEREIEKKDYWRRLCKRRSREL